MPDWMTPVTVALVGLLGTMLVSYVGYRQWRLNRRDSSRTEVVKSRRQTYEALWRLIERIHVDLRKNPQELRVLPGRIVEVNSYVLANEFYLADGDHELVNRYLEALTQMISWAQREGDSATKHLLEITADIPREATAVVRALDLRDELKKRVQNALYEE